MKFTQTKISGVFLIELEKIEDQRGFFSRTFDKHEFQKNDLESDFVQCSISYNHTKGTLRGMHFQLPPYDETKIVSCINGKIFDVVVDLRKDSSTFKLWESNELSSDNFSMLYVPSGVAHGFQTLEDNSTLYYQMSQYFNPKYYSGIKYDDPSFNIDWPLPISYISDNDKNWNIFSEKTILTSNSG
ncbi:dTDP-4-dehydrorhamnose 3,5-epimerase [Nitrosopumilus sp.]|uniref:dTDP-4-dehydrorhamnose 3,5-epimerase n=1 Tax=Nitrosopumilus sp. TaxID=2024843 RepID=UPI003D0DDD95